MHCVMLPFQWDKGLLEVPKISPPLRRPLQSIQISRSSGVLKNCSLRRPLNGEFSVRIMLKIHTRSNWLMNWNRWVTHHTIQSVFWRVRNGTVISLPRSCEFTSPYFFLQIIGLCQQGNDVGIATLPPKVMNKSSKTGSNESAAVHEPVLPIWTMSSCIHKCFDCTWSRWFAFYFLKKVAKPYWENPSDDIK